MSHLKKKKALILKIFDDAPLTKKYDEKLDALPESGDSNFTGEIKKKRKEIVKEKKEKCPRSLIRVDFDDEVKYIRSNLLHTVDKVSIEQEKQFKKFKEYMNDPEIVEKKAGGEAGGKWRNVDGLIS